MDKIISLIKNSKTNGYSKQGLHCFINPFSYLKIRKKGLLEDFDFIYVDGQMLVNLLWIIGVSVSRNSFDMTSLAKKVFNTSIETQSSVYFIGSTQSAIENFIKVVSRSFPKMSIIGNRNGYFTNQEDRKKAIENILYLNPNIVVVGMGTPFQEQFLIDLSKAGWKGNGYTCGGFIHQTSTSVEYYPDFFNKYNLRWLYRIYDEPKLFKRYAFYYPLSSILFFYDFFISSIFNNNSKH